MLLASCSLEDAKKYRNKLVVASDDSKKPIEVILNVVTDTPDDALKEGIGSAKYLTSTVRPTICPESMKGRVFHEIPLEDFTGVDEVDGVVCLVRLPVGFCDMRRVYDVCSTGDEYTDVEAKVRVIGGNLLEIPGVHIGRSDKGKEKMSAVFNGTYDMFDEVSLDDISVKEVLSKIRTGSTKKQGGGTPNAKAKKVETFTKFFGSIDNGF